MNESQILSVKLQPIENERKGKRLMLNLNDWFYMFRTVSLLCSYLLNLLWPCRLTSNIIIGLEELILADYQWSASVVEQLHNYSRRIWNIPGKSRDQHLKESVQIPDRLAYWKFDIIIMVLWSKTYKLNFTILNTQIFV